MKILKLLEKILPLIFWILLIFGFDTPSLSVITLISAFIHELGHLIIGARFGEFTIFAATDGLRIKIRHPLSYRKELILLIGGPFANIVAALISFFVAALLDFNEYFSLFSAVNLLTALSNLLPIAGYDGYKILECIILCKTDSTEIAEKTLKILSFVFTCILTFLSLYLILKLGEGYWIFAVLFSSFISFIRKICVGGILRE